MLKVLFRLFYRISSLHYFPNSPRTVLCSVIHVFFCAHISATWFCCLTTVHETWDILCSGASAAILASRGRHLNFFLHYVQIWIKAGWHHKRDSNYVHMLGATDLVSILLDSMSLNKQYWTLSRCPLRNEYQFVGRKQVFFTLKFSMLHKKTLRGLYE